MGNEANKTAAGERRLGRVCVFCGSNVGRDAAFADAARRLGTLLANRGIGIVTGGGKVGLMGVVADAALAAGGEVIGVLPRALATRELAHRELTDLHVVETMHQRKALMAELSDGFVALPGGLGTLEEICEVLTWAQLGIHRHPCGLLDVAGYWRGLVGFLDHAVEARFVAPEHRAALLVRSDPGELLDAFERYEPPDVPKWLDWGRS